MRFSLPPDRPGGSDVNIELVPERIHHSTASVAPGHNESRELLTLFLGVVRTCPRINRHPSPAAPLQPSQRSGDLTGHPRATQRSCELFDRPGFTDSFSAPGYRDSRYRPSCLLQRVALSGLLQITEEFLEIHRSSTRSRPVPFSFGWPEMESVTQSDNPRITY